jgi:hypothetical protein
MELFWRRGIEGKEDCMAEGSVSIEYEPSFDESVMAVRRQLWRVGNTRKSILLSVVLLLAGAILLTFGGRSSAVGWVGIGAGSLILLLYIWLYTVVARRGAEHAVKDAGPRIMDFSPEGIRIRTKDRDTTIRWTAYSEVTETQDMYVLSHGRRSFTFVPKRAFRSTSDETAFRELAESHIHSDSE